MNAISVNDPRFKRCLYFPFSSCFGSSCHFLSLSPFHRNDPLFSPTPSLAIRRSASVDSAQTAPARPPARFPIAENELSKVRPLPQTEHALSPSLDSSSTNCAENCHNIVTIPVETGKHISSFCHSAQRWRTRRRGEGGGTKVCP